MRFEKFAAAVTALAGVALAVGTPAHAQTIICCQRGCPSRQWIAALGLRAYDVLVEPYNSEEVQRVLERTAARIHKRSLRRDQRAHHTLWLSPGESAF